MRVDAPLDEWAYCDGVFEPTVRALLRFGAAHASNDVDHASDHVDSGEVVVGIEVVDDATVRVSLSVPGWSVSATHRQVLEEGVDPEAPVDANSSDELSCWLVHWGVERIGGAVRVEDETVSLRLPRYGDPDT
jgi:hypothetical protein